MSDEATPRTRSTCTGCSKAASEQVVDTVARISAVQGSSDAPRSQDAGFGYFVASIVRALRAGDAVHGLGGPDINNVATPTLASDAARLIARIAEGGHRGTFHCCGGQSVTRRELALRTVDVFGLDGDAALLRAAAGPAVAGAARHPARRDGDRRRARRRAAGLDDQLRRLERSLTCTT